MGGWGGGGNDRPVGIPAQTLVLVLRPVTVAQCVCVYMIVLKAVDTHDVETDVWLKQKRMISLNQLSSTETIFQVRKKGE